MNIAEKYTYPSPESVITFLKKNNITVKNIGETREGIPIESFSIGDGVPLVLVAYCHADEPVGGAVIMRIAEHYIKHGTLWKTPVNITFIPCFDPYGASRNKYWYDVPLTINRNIRYRYRQERANQAEWGHLSKGDSAMAAIVSELNKNQPKLLCHLHNTRFANSAIYLSGTKIRPDFADSLSSVLTSYFTYICKIPEKPYQNKISEGVFSFGDKTSRYAYEKNLSDKRQTEITSAGNHVFDHLELAGYPLSIIPDIPIFYWNCMAYVKEEDYLIVRELLLESYSLIEDIIENQKYDILVTDFVRKETNQIINKQNSFSPLDLLRMLTALGAIWHTSLYCNIIELNVLKIESNLEMSCDIVSNLLNIKTYEVDYICNIYLDIIKTAISEVVLKR